MIFGSTPHQTGSIRFWRCRLRSGGRVDRSKLPECAVGREVGATHCGERRTSRGSMGHMEAYVAALTELRAANELNVGDAFDWWISQARKHFAADGPNSISIRE